MLWFSLWTSSMNWKKIKGGQTKHTNMGGTNKMCEGGRTKIINKNIIWNKWTDGLISIINMDINIWPTYFENFCQKLIFFEKVYIKNALPTISKILFKNYKINLSFCFSITWSLYNKQTWATDKKDKGIGFINFSEP